MKRLFYIVNFFCGCYFSVTVFGQTNTASKEYSFLFYNTENFFDCENDSLTDDDEFTPEGDRHWNSYRMHSKAERLGKVILAAGKWNPPVCVGLCEVENLKVLELLTGNAPLTKFGYKIVHKESPDERGIDVAFLYRQECFKPFDYSAIEIRDANDPSFKSRDILRVSGVYENCDTIHFFVNHWPSRYGGVMETAKFRQLAASILKKSIQEIQRKSRQAKIVCMGDFNDSPADESLSKVLQTVENNVPEIAGELINLSSNWVSRSIQTIKNQYNWDVFDQFIVSDFFLQSGKCFEFLRAEIFDAGFLLEPDSKFGGVRPKRTFVGFSYQEGFSDHLPVVLRFQKIDY